MDCNAENLKAEYEKLQAELAAARGEVAYLRALIDTLPNPIFAKKGDLRFCIINKAYEEFFGVSRDNLLGHTVMDLEYLPFEERQRYQTEDQNAILDCSAVHDQLAFDTPNGSIHSTYWSHGFEVPTTKDRGLVGMIVDISTEHMLEQELVYKVQALEDAQQELHHLSNTDPLTNLPNRRFFEERLSENIALARRHGQPLCLLMADLDFFKHVNDTYGHDSGDVVLQQFAEVLSTSCRLEDVAARIGGEEFVLLLPMTELENARIVAERVRSRTEKEVLLPDNKLQTASIGLAQLAPDETQESFIKRADEALYRAKTSGRNRVCE